MGLQVGQVQGLQCVQIFRLFLQVKSLNQEKYYDLHKKSKKLRLNTEIKQIFTLSYFHMMQFSIQKRPDLSL
jgi:predicted MPP superfamily phosphohydrolase